MPPTNTTAAIPTATVVGHASVFKRNSRPNAQPHPKNMNVATASKTMHAAKTITQF
jgi:hypothetical protein